MALPSFRKKKIPPIAGNHNNAIAQYFQSKITEQTTFKHYPEWDTVKSEPMLELMRVHREILIADADLEAKHLEYKERKQKADLQWEDLRHKDDILRRSFINFNDFVTVNRDKRERAQRKITDEKERQKIREAEIKELEKNLAIMIKVRNKMKQFVELYKPFQKYLERVIETNQFQSIAEIFNRYETLIDTRLSLIKKQDHTLHKLENTTSQLQRMNEKQSRSLMDLNSQIAQLQDKLANARTLAMRWESVMSRVKEVASRKELDEAQARASIWNLYRQICWRKGVPITAKREDLEQQLLVTKRTIVELVKIVRTAKIKAKKEAREKEQKKQIKTQQQTRPDSNEELRRRTKTSVLTAEDSSLSSVDT